MERRDIPYDCIVPTKQHQHNSGYSPESTENILHKQWSPLHRSSGYNELSESTKLAAKELRVPFGVVHYSVTLGTYARVAVRPGWAALLWARLVYPQTLRPPTYLA